MSASDEPVKFRIPHHWANYFGHLLADFWRLEFMLKRGEAYLRNVSWADAKKDEAWCGRTLGPTWREFRKRAGEGLNDTTAVIEA